MRDVHPGAPRFGFMPRHSSPGWSGTLASLAPASSSAEEGLVGESSIEGIRVPKFYIGNVELQNQGDLREGMSGNAKILVGRRSVAEFAWRFARDLVAYVCGDIRSQFDRQLERGCNVLQPLSVFKKPVTDCLITGIVPALKPGATPSPRPCELLCGAILRHLCCHFVRYLRRDLVGYFRRNGWTNCRGKI